MDASRRWFWRKVRHRADADVRMRWFDYQRHVLRRPLAYLMQSQPFGELDLAIRAPILIPRSETEQWTMYLVRRMRHGQLPSKILDICSGSGCIGLQLAKSSPASRVTGIDINPHAVRLARLNARKHSISNAEFEVGDLLNDNWMKKHQGSFDLIVSNPPYVTDQEHSQLDPEVRLHEDRRALVGSVSSNLDGLLYYKKIAELAPTLLRPPIRRSAGTFIVKRDIPLLADQHTIERPLRLVMEFGEGQTSGILNILKKHGFTEGEVWRDFAGKERVVAMY